MYIDRMRVLRGLRYELDDLADDADRLDAYIVSELFDEEDRAGKLMLLRRHAALVWRMQDLEEQIAHTRMSFVGR